MLRLKLHINSRRMKSLNPKPRVYSTGFSLMEMAVVLMIMGTLLGGILVAVSQTTENNRRTQTRVQLKEIEQALYGFVIANGRLPCPSTHTTAGIEAPPGGVACISNYGFVPAATLGVFGQVNSDGLLVDAWQNPYRYAVAPYDTTQASNFVSPGGFKYFFDNDPNFDDPNGGSSLELLNICETDACNVADVIADKLPVVVLSMGANWANTTSDEEVENGAEATLGAYNIPNDSVFVDTDYNEETFDDILLWLSPYIIYNYLLNSGGLE